MLAGLRRGWLHGRYPTRRWPVWFLPLNFCCWKFRLRSFIPLVISATLATSVRFLLLGSGAMFHFSGVDFGIPAGLPYYLILGGLCGFAAIGLTKFLYWMEDMFDHLPISDLWHPAIGALGLGIIGFFVPRVLGVGYDTISGILNNQFTLHILIVLLVFKMLAMVISLGSGTPRPARANIYVQCCNGRSVRNGGQPFYSFGESFTGRVCAGCDGRGIRRGVAFNIGILERRILKSRVTTILYCR